MQNLLKETAVSLQQAVRILHAASFREFHNKQREIALNIQFKKSVKDVKGIVLLPNKFQVVRTLVFAPQAALDDSLEAATETQKLRIKQLSKLNLIRDFGNKQQFDKFIQLLKDGTTNPQLAEYNRFICHPEYLPVIMQQHPEIMDAEGEKVEGSKKSGGYGRVLGPHNLMPSLKKAETVSEQPFQQILKSFEQDKDAVSYRMDNNGFLSVVLGRSDTLTSPELQQNFETFMKHVQDHPTERIQVKSVMGELIVE